jgi:hypothetical protein
MFTPEEKSLPLIFADARRSRNRLAANQREWTRINSSFSLQRATKFSRKRAFAIKLKNPFPDSCSFAKSAAHS